MNSNQKEILERVLLMMNYNSSRTLNENLEIIVEQSDANWKTKYACVPKHYGATKATLSDGSTAYKINGLYYYNNGRAQPSRTYSCNDAFFKYPKNQVEGDSFRKWFYKNYSNDKYLGNVAKKYKVSPSGPYNSPELRKAWEMYGDDFLEGGGKLTPDEVINKRKEIENSDIDGYMRKVWGTSFSMPNAKSKQEWINGYAKYAAKEIEGAIYMVWSTNPDGKCSRKDKSFLDDKLIGLKWPSLWERLNKKGRYGGGVTSTGSVGGKTPEYYNSYQGKEKPTPKLTGGGSIVEYNTCYNEDVAMGLKTAYKPSWDHVVKAYGITPEVSVEDIVSKLYEVYNSGGGKISNIPSYTNKRIYAGSGSSKKSGGITMEEFHNIMMVLEIASAFIPGIGPILSFGFGMTDALFYFDEDPELGFFVLLLTIAPELRLFTNSIKAAKATGVYSTTLNKLMRGDVKTLTSQEISFVKEIKSLVEANKGEVKAEVKQVVGKEADKILNNPSSKKQLTPEEIKSLRTVSAAKNLEYLKLDTLFGIAVPFTTKYGRDILKRIFGLYEENLGPLTDAQWVELEDKLNEIPKEVMPQTVAAWEKDPEEFKAYVKDEKVSKAINSRLENLSRKVPLDQLPNKISDEDIAILMADEPNQ
jgi:hypothetical protein